MELRKNKYNRINKKSLFVYLDIEDHEDIARRAGNRNITISEWVRMAIIERKMEEDKYL